MEIIRNGSATTLSKPGVQSEQLVFPENSPSRRVTITRVTASPQAINAPLRHSSSEQFWVALAGRGMLLLDKNGPNRSLPATSPVSPTATFTACTMPATRRSSILL